MAVYTSGRWKVTTGNESEFINTWTELATHTKTDFPGATAMLLQDRDDPTVFLSFGPWESVEQIEEWARLELVSDRRGQDSTAACRVHPTNIGPGRLGVARPLRQSSMRGDCERVECGKAK
jgi:heme-degrading monooxygenase HmoA